MSELHNPLFDDEREFLERQKLEYERALLGDVDHIKDQTKSVGKYVAIGAALLGGFWLVSKALGRGDEDDDPKRSRKKLKSKKGSPKRKPQLVAHSDDYGFGASVSEAHPRAHLAPPVYHATADADPFPAFDRADSDVVSSVPATAYQSSHQQRYGNGREYSRPEPKGSMVIDTLRVLAESDTGKMLIGQLSGVLIALVTRKVNEWMDVHKNSDLAASGSEPETKDIDFVIHHDDAHAPDATA